MITFPNAKINLGLNIVEKRPDGYHNLETIFYPINLQDALEVTRRENNVLLSLGSCDSAMIVPAAGGLGQITDGLLQEIDMGNVVQINGSTDFCRIFKFLGRSSVG